MRHLGTNVIEEYDQRWKQVGMFPYMKIFRKGTSDLTCLTAKELRTISFSLPFVLNGLADTKVIETVVSYLKWRRILGQEAFTEKCLLSLDEVARELQDKMNKFTNYVYGHDIRHSIKFHSIIHWSLLIRRFGCPSNYNTETLESAHKIFVKKWCGRLLHRGSAVARTPISRDMVADLHSIRTNYIHQQQTHKLIRGKGEIMYFENLPPKLKKAIKDFALQSAVNIDSDTEVVTYRSVWSNAGQCWNKRGQASHDVWE